MQKFSCIKEKKQRQLKDNQLLNIAIQAALKAGDVIMEVYNSDDFEVESKSDDSPLTKADKQANDVINSFLLTTNIPIISEENKQIAYQERKNWNRCWVVDPVDGTKEFIKRNGEFTVNIALVQDELPLLGVIYVPVTKELYFSDVSTQESFKTIINNSSISIDEIFSNAKLLTGSVDTNLIQVVGSRSHMSQETLDYVNELKKSGKEVEIVSKGSSLKFCLVADGKADVYPRFAPTMEWDTAAGQAICNAIGIDVISSETNEMLRYNKENLLNPWFIVK